MTDEGDSGAHRVTLPCGWFAWRQFMLRGAGFPASRVLALGSEQLAAIADQALDGQLDSFESAHAGFQLECSAALRDVAREPRFREALAWQNRGALHTGVDWLLSHADAPANKPRSRKEQLVASYLQRYALKNDTIGFFGPIGWGHIRADDTFEIAPGPELVSDRVVYFEEWAIDRLAARIASEPEVKQQLAPRRIAGVSLEGTTLHYGAGKTAELDEEVALALAGADGQTSAFSLAEQLIERGVIDDYEELDEILEELVEHKLVDWSFGLPSSMFSPGSVLEHRIARLPDVARARAFALFEKVARGRSAIAAAAGDAERLEDAVESLERTFEQVTGGSASRHRGETYGARTLVYEDCTRDLTMEVGRSVLDRLDPVLAVVLPAARWYTANVAAQFHQVIEARCEGIEWPIGLGRLWREIGPLFGDGSTRPEVVRAVRADLRERWLTLIQKPAGESRLELDGSSLVDRASELFAARCPGWPAARHVSPDVMLAARDVNALSTGQFTPVIGEVHIGNSQMVHASLQHCTTDRRESMLAAFDREVEGPRLLPVELKGMVTRADLTNRSPRDYHVELGPSRSWRAPERVLRVEDLVVERQEGNLVIAHRERDLRFSFDQFLGQYLSFVAYDLDLRPAGSHIPRISIDGVVICREQWRFEETPAFAGLPRGSGRFLAARRWARDCRLPRWGFARIPEERKPVFIDLASPIFVDILARMARKGTALTLTEMLPSFDELWLPDSQGARYTCELRIVCVDPEPWRRGG